MWGEYDKYIYEIYFCLQNDVLGRVAVLLIKTENSKQRELEFRCEGTKNFFFVVGFYLV